MSPDGGGALGRYSELVAGILSILIESGLKRLSLSSEDLWETHPSLASNPNDFDSMFVDTLTWLRDEGYVRFESFVGGTNGETCVAGLAPTALCLQLLEQRIPALDNKSGRVIIEEARSSDTPAAAYVRAGSLLGGLMGGFTKAIS